MGAELSRVGSVEGSSSRGLVDGTIVGVDDGCFDASGSRPVLPFGVALGASWWIVGCVDGGRRGGDVVGDWVIATGFLECVFL